MESIQFWRFVDAFYGAAGCGRTEHSMGKQFSRACGDLGIRIGNCLPGKKTSCYRCLRDQFCHFSVLEKCHHRRYFSCRSFTHNRAHVPAVYIFYDHRSGNFCVNEKRQDHRGNSRRVGRICVAAQQLYLRTFLCTFPCWSCCKIYRPEEKCEKSRNNQAA